MILHDEFSLTQVLDRPPCRISQDCTVGEDAFDERIAVERAKGIFY
jgi:hypothetical protein